MTLFEEIVKEVIDTDIYKNNKPNPLALGGIKSRFFEGDRYYLDLGERYGKYPIVTLPEMIEAFDREYLKGEEATAEMVLKACRERFFDTWITYKSVAPTIVALTPPDKDGKKPKYYANKGTALEFIFGKARDNKSESDIIGAELKAYAGHAPLITLFDLSPYEIWHYEAPGAPPVKEPTQKMRDVLKKIQKKACPPEKAATKQLNTRSETDFRVGSRSYARVIINDTDGKANAEAIGIYTQFFGLNELNEEYPIDAIECIYSVEKTTKVMNGLRDKKDKKNLYQTVSDKIQTVFSFTTTQLDINGVSGLTPGDTAKTNSVYSYSALHISSLKNVEDLMLNFIECINNEDIIVSFKITKTLSLSARFSIKNNVGSYDRLYRNRKTGEVLYQNDNNINAGSVGPEALVQRNADGTYTNDYSEWTKAQWEKHKNQEEEEPWTDEEEEEPANEIQPEAGTSAVDLPNNKTELPEPEYKQK